MVETNEKYIEAVGRRKTSVARVRITPAAKNSITVNEKELHEYFPIDEMQLIAREPLIEKVGEKFVITAHINGGGIHSQSEALRPSRMRLLLIVSTLLVSSRVPAMSRLAMKLLVLGSITHKLLTPM